MKRERTFWGMFFILGAVAMIAGKLGFLGGFGFWTVLFTIFLAACLAKSIVRRSMTGVLFTAAFLCIVYDRQLGITALTPWTVLGAAFLGSIGFSLLRRPRMGGFYRHCGRGRDFTHETVQDCAGEGQRLHLETAVAGSVKYVRSDDFRGADLRCSFGALTVYFDNAVIRGGEAEVNLDVSFGGVELFIPKEWAIVNEVSLTLSGLEEKNSSRAAAAGPVLRLTGNANLSGISITYV